MNRWTEDFATEADRGLTAGETRPRPLPSSTSGFSLVELLVVVAVISVLASLLLPALTEAIESARTMQCRNNLKQVALSQSYYGQDFGDWIHWSGHNVATPDLSWASTLMETAYFPREGSDALLCPSEAPHLYDTPNHVFGAASQYNPIIVFVPQARLVKSVDIDWPTWSNDGIFLLFSAQEHASAGIVYFDSWNQNQEAQSNWPKGFNNNAVALRHAEQASCLFLDGHVEGYGYGAMKDYEGSKPVWLGSKGEYTWVP